MTCWLCHLDSKGKERCELCRSDMDGIVSLLARAGDEALPVISDLIKRSEPVRARLREERAKKEAARQERMAAALAVASPDAAAGYRSRVRVGRRRW